jgi:hypothetical protein
MRTDHDDEVQLVDHRGGVGVVSAAEPPPARRDYDLYAR